MSGADAKIHSLNPIRTRAVDRCQTARRQGRGRSPKQPPQKSPGRLGLFIGKSTDVPVYHNLAALRGEMTIEAAADEVRKASRHYAKRQLTWFRRNKAMHWLIRKGTGGEILDQARQFLREFDK